MLIRETKSRDSGINVPEVCLKECSKAGWLQQMGIFHLVCRLSGVLRRLLAGKSFLCSIARLTV